MRRRVREARVGRLGTIDGRGRPHLVPFVFAIEGDTLYSPVDRKPKTTTELQRMKNLRANPAATVLVDHYEEAWERVWWVRLRGRGRILEPGTEEFARAERLLEAKYDQYRGQGPQAGMIAMDVEDWLGWSYSP